MANEKTVKSIYLDKDEKHLCKLASLELGFGKLESLYVAAIEWYLGQKNRFPYGLQKKKGANCVSVWMSQELSDRIDLAAAEMNLTVAGLIHCAIIFYLEVNGYFEGIWKIDWKGKK